MVERMFTRDFDRKIHIFLAVVVCSALVGMTFGVYALWPANVERGYAPEQPIAFSHALHAGRSGIEGKRGLKIDCLYCHSRVEDSPHATVPTVETCMNCHREVQPTVTDHDAAHHEEASDHKEEIAGEEGTKEQSHKGTEGEVAEAQGDKGEEKLIKDIPQGKKLNEGIAKLLEHYIENKPIRWVKVHDLADFVYFDHSRHMKAGLSCIDCHGDVGRMERMTRVYSLKMKWCLDCHQQPATETTSELYQNQVFQGRVGLRGPIHCSACHR